MVGYTVDTQPRARVYFVIAAISIPIAEVVSSSLNAHPFSLSAPSALMVFGVFVWLYDLRLWNLPVISKLSAIPDLNGLWSGTLHRQKITVGLPAIDEARFQIDVSIAQSWHNIDVVIRGPRTVCQTVTACLYASNPHHVRLKFVYVVKKIRAQTDPHISDEGMGELYFDASTPGVVTGIFFSNKARIGEMRLEKVDAFVSRELLDLPVDGQSTKREDELRATRSGNY